MDYTTKKRQNRVGIQFVAKSAFWMILKIYFFSWIYILFFSQTFFIYLFNEDLSIEQVFCVIRAVRSDPVDYLTSISKHLVDEMGDFVIHKAKKGAAGENFEIP